MTTFSTIRRENVVPEAQREIIWNTSTLFHFDSHTNQWELEVQRIIHLQGIAILDAFTNNKKIIKSHIFAANQEIKQQ